MTAFNTSEALLRTRDGVAQVRRTRLATQKAIEGSRKSLAETRALLVALRYRYLLREKAQRLIGAKKRNRRQATIT